MRLRICRTVACVLALGSVSATAQAQLGGGRGGGQSKPTQSAPIQNRSVGPRSGGGDDDEPRATVQQRGEPTVQAPADPLAVSPEMAARIGTDSDLRPTPPVGELTRQYFPYYMERRGDYRFRMVPPLYIEHTRYADTPYEDRESLSGLVYYQRRSPKLDMDVVFPLAWRVRDRENHVLVLGPLAHREAPMEHDNWVAPLVFEGERKDGGYFHSPALLTSSHWNAKGAFTISALYFRDRTGTDVDAGVVPFYFHGDNGNVDGARKSYTLIPPALFFHRDREIDESSLTVVGPVILKSDAKRSIVDVAPLFFHIKGKPDTGGIREEHTTLLPLFHYGVSEAQSLFVVPGYLRRVTATADTLLTPIYSHATTRGGATSLTFAGPLLPLYYNYSDKDIGYTSFGAFPFYYQSDGPTGHSFLTPFFARFESYGVSRTYYAFPNVVVSQDLHGWETDVLPIVFAGRSDDRSHTVLAPVFWDFASKTGRTTVGAPLYFRTANTADDSVIQVAANTLYIQKHVAGGRDWQFHVLPIFSYGENPNGYFWNVLFGLTGYERAGSYGRIRAFWLPIQVSGPAAAASVGNQSVSQ